MKLVAIDLDDTLLREDLTVSDRNIKAIRHFISLGHAVILASGRGPFSMKKYAKIIGLDSYIVSYNGAMVMDLKNDEIIYEKGLPRPLVKEVVKYAGEHDLAIQTYEAEVIVSSMANDYTLEDSRLTSMDLRIEPDFSDYVKEHPPIKFVFPNDHELLSSVESDLKGLFKSRANIFFSKPFFLEVMHPDNNKYRGIQMVAERLGIQEADICAIGDSMNDLEMIRDSAVGIAVKNAKQEVKDLANWVLDYTNEEDGVSYALEAILGSH